MNNSKFHKLANSLILKIEKKIENHPKNNKIDYEINNNILYIYFHKDKKIIINKQEYLKQIWLANNFTGHHFQYQKKEWICNRTNLSFWKILNNYLFSII